MFARGGASGKEDRRGPGRRLSNRPSRPACRAAVAWTRNRGSPAFFTAGAAANRSEYDDPQQPASVGAGDGQDDDGNRVADPARKQASQGHHRSKITAPAMPPATAPTSVGALLPVFRPR